MSNFTNSYIEGLKPAAKRYEKYQPDGFGICVTPKDIKTWIYRYKSEGKTYKLPLGQYPQMDLMHAYQQFLEISNRLRAKKKLKDKICEASIKKHHTVKDLILAWYNGYAQKFRKDPKQIQQCFKY